MRARVSGYLVKDSFPEGEEVKTGDLLFEIDPQTYQKTLDAVRADLKAAEAQLKLADAEYGRARLLLSRSAVSPEEVDVRLGAQRVADAVVGQILRYMGFVKEQRAEEGQTVHGVIIAHEDDNRIRSALSMTPNILFYRYEVSFKLKKG